MNPYHVRNDYSFWKRSVAGVKPEDIDPVTHVPFMISKMDKIATAGSCFAQHISRTLADQGYQYLVTETAPGGAGENYGIFPARTGNIYTARQMLQIFDRAYALFDPSDTIWRRKDGAFVDPFRPQIEAAGFATEEALIEDRKRHLAAVRAMFEECDIFIFTLGLTEGWASKIDGAIFPVAPGVAGGDFDEGKHEFVNFMPEAIVADLREFLDKLRAVNWSVRVIFTVSPVPLIATYEDRHVLVSNTFSKAALRVAAELVTRSDPSTFYFPSFEIITNAQSKSAYFANDLRNVTDDGVAHVMKVFRHLLSDTDWESPRMRQEAEGGYRRSIQTQERLRAYSKVICDEEAIDAESDSDPRQNDKI